MVYCGKRRNEIINDLKSMEGGIFFKTYFKTTEVWYFNNQINSSPSVYTPKLTSIMCENFNIEENDYLIVGSAKLGFSLSPWKKLRVFNPSDDGENPQSDIDVAIISPRLFNDLWKGLKILKYRTHVNAYPRICSNVFRGFINDKNIFDQITIESKVVDMVDNCTRDMRDNFGIIQPINYRFYNSWEDLEKYTIDGIIKCKGK